MRAALLTWDMPPRPTGLGRAANEVAQALRLVGVDVTVFSADRKGTGEEDGLRIVGVQPDAFLARTRQRACRGHLAMPTAFVRALAGEHARTPFDLVEATNWYAPGALVPRPGVSRLGIPLVVRCSTPAVDALDPSGDERHRRDLAFAHALERRTLLRSAAVIYNTAPHAAAMRETYDLPRQDEDDHGGDVIGLSLDDAVIARGRAAPYPESGPLTCLFVGRAERRKGFDEMLRAFALIARHRAARLHLVGLSPGDLARAAARLGLDRDVLAHLEDHGRVEDAVMDRLMAASHLVLAPSRYESYGLVYREAAAWGRPVVMCAEDPSAREFAGTGAGVLAAACEPEAIARAAAEAHARRADLRAAGLAHAATLGRRVLGERTLAVYERALGAR